MIDVSFADFDTACYNLQHNVIELIKHTVGISIEINSNEQKIEQELADLRNIDQGLYDIINNIVDAMRTTDTILTQINDVLYDHEQRIRALEGR